MRLLFLDDDKSRTRRFKQALIGHSVVCVETPEEAINALQEQDRFGLISLDHDLFGKIYQPSDEKSGFAVCQFLRSWADNDKMPDQILCHSYNAGGVEKMMAELEPLAVDSYAHPFDSDDYWSRMPITEMPV
jgi:CheY-like chemotaxis protein